jgi:hypothetical protein
MEGKRGTVAVMDWAPLLVRVPLTGTKEKRRTESVMVEKFALLLWLKFSIGNR